MAIIIQGSKLEKLYYVITYQPGSTKMTSQSNGEGHLWV